VTADEIQAFRLAWDAFNHSGQHECQYHKSDFGYLGWTGHPNVSEPRCGSCRQPWRVTRAVAAIAHAMDGRVLRLGTEEE